MSSSNLNINTDLAREILTGFIRSEITRTGFPVRWLGFPAALTLRFPAF